jgi:hypothetical protein
MRKSTRRVGDWPVLIALDYSRHPSWSFIGCLGPLRSDEPMASETTMI